MLIYEIKSEGRDTSYRKKFTLQDALDSCEWRLKNKDAFTVIPREVTKPEYDQLRKESGSKGE